MVQARQFSDLEVAVIPRSPNDSLALVAAPHRRNEAFRAGNKEQEPKSATPMDESSRLDTVDVRRLDRQKNKRTHNLAQSPRTLDGLAVPGDPRSNDPSIGRAANLKKILSNLNATGNVHTANRRGYPYCRRAFHRLPAGWTPGGVMRCQPAPAFSIAEPGSQARDSEKYECLDQAARFATYYLRPVCGHFVRSLYTYF